MKKGITESDIIKVRQPPDGGLTHPTDRVTVGCVTGAIESRVTRSAQTGCYLAMQAERTLSWCANAKIALTPLWGAASPKERVQALRP